jgi:AraC-like DNA-binding protein
MDPISEAAREALDFLCANGPAWTDRRQWVLGPDRPAAGNRAIHVGHPAFAYFWETRGARIQVTFHPPGEIDPGPARTLVIEPAESRLRLHLPGRSVLVIEPVEPAVQRRIGDLIRESSESSAATIGEWHHQLRILGCAMRLIALTADAARITRSPDSSSADRPDLRAELVDALHLWLRQTLGQPVGLADAATRFDKSPRQLIRILKDDTGAGFGEHLAMRRLTQARAGLMHGSASILELASDVGFSSSEPFIRAFRRTFGWTPLQFRKAWVRAAHSGGRLEELCTVSQRQAVRWIPAEQLAATAGGQHQGPPHTLVVANALHEPAELFLIPPGRNPTRTHVLESGAMVFIHRDHGGSLWHARATGGGGAGSFTTPDTHALAILSEEHLGSRKGPRTSARTSGPD